MLKVKSNLPWQRMGDDVVIISSENNEVFELNSSGADIWEFMAKEPKSRNDVLNFIEDTFEIESDLAELDLDDFILTLNAKGLLDN